MTWDGFRVTHCDDATECSSASCRRSHSMTRTEERVKADAWCDALETARTLDLTGEQPEWDGMDRLDLMGLLDLIGRAREQKRLAGLVASAAKQRAAAILGEGGAVTDGRVLYRYGAGIDRKVVDPVELIQWLGPEDAASVLNIQTAVSIERFRQLAESRGQDVRELEGHFFLEERTPPELSEVPLDNKRAPKYAAGMKPGVIRRSR